MSQEWWQIAGVVGDAVSGLFAVVAVLAALWVAKGQIAVSREQNRITQEQNRITSHLGEQEARLAAQQTLLTQRQLLLPLWDYLSKLNDIDPRPDKVVWPDVLQIANTLELVALCWEGNLIDQQIIRRTFADKYLHLCRQLRLCTSPPDGQKNGPALLAENRAATALLNLLEQEEAERNKLAPLK